MAAIAPKRFAGVNEVLAQAQGRRFTAAVVRIEHEGVPLYERAYGETHSGSGALAIGPDTMFDLASLTKLFTATAALAQIGTGSYALDLPLLRFFPEWREHPHAAVTARMLLAHTAGFASGADYRQLQGVSVERFALGADPVAPAGETVVYSDLGFIALGVAIARAQGRALAAAVADMCAQLELESTRFRPQAAQRAAIPATETDAWRGLSQGTVHDEKAYLMGGVAGHAGLFGTARDVARLTEVYLGNRRRRQPAIVPPELLAAALEQQAGDPVLRRGLGWALKTSDETSCGTLMSATTFGHTGFTGTCVWADPERDLSIVLLTNAVHFGRGDIRDLRAAVCDRAVEALRLS